eukprot:jgi/Ulvmu1/12294/UM088_0010.1
MPQRCASSYRRVDFSSNATIAFLHADSSVCMQSARPVRATYASVLRAPPVAEATTADHQHDLQPALGTGALFWDIAAAQSEVVKKRKQAPQLPAEEPLPVATEAPAGRSVHDAVDARDPWTLVRRRRGRRPTAVAEAATTEAAANAEWHSTWKQGAAIPGNRFDPLQDMLEEDDTITQEVRASAADRGSWLECRNACVAVVYPVSLLCCHMHGPVNHNGCCPHAYEGTGFFKAAARPAHRRSMPPHNSTHCAGGENCGWLRRIVPGHAQGLPLLRARGSADCGHRCHEWGERARIRLRETRG